MNSGDGVTPEIVDDLREFYESQRDDYNRREPIADLVDWAFETAIVPLQQVLQIRYGDNWKSVQDRLQQEQQEARLQLGASLADSLIAGFPEDVHYAAQYAAGNIKPKERDYRHAQSHRVEAALIVWSIARDEGRLPDRAELIDKTEQECAGKFGKKLTRRSWDQIISDLPCKLPGIGRGRPKK
jgi:hypothetical protein